MSSQSHSDQLHLPPLTLSLFHAEHESSNQQQNDVVRGSSYAQPHPEPSHQALILAPSASSEPSTPNSSGYAGERGSVSSTATSTVFEIEEIIVQREIEELNIDDDQYHDAVSNSNNDSLLEKRTTSR